MNILVLNPGSSTLKFKLLHAQSPRDIDTRIKGAIDRVTDMRQAMQEVERRMDGQPIDAVGYRVVHGGEKFEQAVRIDEAVLQEIRKLTVLAPLHNAGALAAINAGLKTWPDVPAVAVFDTAFHRTLPEVARRYAIDRTLADANELHRFGFHGISHQYVSATLLRCMKREARGSRLITCHLGNGASICAICDGRSVDTSMGLTPLEGLVMGTRSGDVDPGLVLHLMRAMKMSVEQVDDLLNHRSGLLGLSQRSGDVRDLEQAAASDPRAAEALEAFAYRCRKYIGAYAAALGGIDAIAFSGGIGQHSPAMRRRIVRGLEFLGIALDDRRNRAADGSAPADIGSGAVAVWVIPTDEERQVAEDVFKLCAPVKRKEGGT